LVDARSFVEAHRHFLLLGHADPDADCLGAQIVLRSWLLRLGKTAVCLSDGPFERPEIRAFADQFARELDPAAARPDAVILVDCSSIERTGTVGRFAAGLPALVVDHHASGDPFGDVRVVDKDSASSTLLVLRLIESFGMRPTPDEAQVLLLGFCTDTGFFRHLDSRAVPAMTEVGRLLEYGASPQRAFREIYGGRELGQTRLFGRLLDRAESHGGGRVLLTWVTVQDTRETGGSSRGLNDLYQYLQMVQGCEVVVLIKEDSSAETSVSLRSSGDYDVGRVAKSLGGGGHRGAAGYTVKAPVDQVRRRILERLLPEIGG
jgi:bifunctional oligoribonuclease and PAP phosphatase NrnA